MRRLFQVLCVTLSTLMLATSCLKSDDDETTLYDDMAVTAFSLGTLNRYLHTTASTGEDSVYKVSYSAASYKFYIDQLKHEVYNVDSLPYATDMRHVICSVTTKNSGVAYLKSLTSDSLFYYSSSDSIDFSSPRVLRVYAIDGSGSRDYTIRVNVRSVAPGGMSWERMADGTAMPSGNSADPAGIDWSQEELDEDPSLLPQTDVALVSWPLSGGAEYALLVGYCEQASTKAMTIWRKLTDMGQGRWVYMPLAEDNPYYLPSGTCYLLLCYQDGVLAVDVRGKIYQSRDQGITWKSTKYSMPASWSGTVTAAAADGDGYLWLQSSEGQVWRGLFVE